MMTVRMTRMKIPNTVVSSHKSLMFHPCKASRDFLLAVILYWYLLLEGTQCKGFLCSNHTCLPASAHCNGIKECPDGADENNCGEWSRWFRRQFSSQTLTCNRKYEREYNHLTALLIPSHVWFVVKVIVFSSLVSPTDPLCTRYMEFVCQNRAQCLFQSLVCDGIKHCEDGSDEDAEYAQCGERQASPLWHWACLQQPSCDHPSPCNTWPGHFIKQRCRVIIVPNKGKGGGWVCFPLTRAPEQWIVRFVLCVWICLSLQLGFASGNHCFDYCRTPNFSRYFLVSDVSLLWWHRRLAFCNQIQ